MIYSREKDEIAELVFGLSIRFDINGYGADLPPEVKDALAGSSLSVNN